MQRLAAGDIDALGTLVSRHQTRALRTVYLVTHDLALAEDVVSGAFLRVFERAAQYDPSRPFGPWLYRIVVNDAIKAVRRRDRTTTLDLAGDKSGPEASTDPATAAVLNEEREAVRAALARLTPTQRGAIVMRYFLWPVRGRDGGSDRSKAGHCQTPPSRCESAAEASAPTCP